MLDFKLVDSRYQAIGILLEQISIFLIGYVSVAFKKLQSLA